MVGRASEGREGVVVDTAKERVFGPLVAAQHGGRETEHWKFYHKFKVYGSRNKVSLPRPQHQPQRRKPVTTIMLAQVASATLYCKRGKKGKGKKKRGGGKEGKKNHIPSLPTSKSGDDARDTLANFIRVSGFKVIFVSV